MVRNIVVVLVALILSACQSVPASRPQPEPERSSGAVSPPAPVRPLGYDATSDLADVSAFAKKLPPATTLVIFDIDDTLLSTPFISGNSGPRRFFGSDAWFSWQYPMKGKGTHAIKCLFDFLAINYETDTQPATPDAASTVKAIAGDKILLTSRSPDYRSGTERELREANILPIKQLTMDPNVFIRRPDGVSMTYFNGIYMTKGADKGEALFALLNHLGIDRKYDTVILADDGWKNIQSMYAAVTGRGIQFHGFLYEGVKKDPYGPNGTGAGPDPNDIQAADTAWTDWLDALALSYPERKERFVNEICAKEM